MEQKSKQSNITVLTAVFFLLVGLFTGYLIRGMNYTNGVPQLTQSPSPSSAQNTMNIVNWSTYDVPNSRYSIKYPGSWIYVKGSDISRLIPPSCIGFSDVEPLDIPDRISPTGHSLITVCYVMAEMPSTIVDSYDNEDLASLRKVNLNGYEGIRGNAAGPLGAGESVFLKNGKSFVSINYELGNKKVFEEMVQSLRFK